MIPSSTYIHCDIVGTFAIGVALVLVNVQVITSSAATATFAVAVPLFTVLLFEQVSPVRFQPAGTVSVTL